MYVSQQVAVWTRMRLEYTAQTAWTNSLQPNQMYTQNSSTKPLFLKGENWIIWLHRLELASRQPPETSFSFGEAV